MRGLAGYAGAAVVGVTVGALVFAPHTPAQLESAPAGGLVEIAEQELADARTVELAVATSGAQPIRFAGSGTVTSVACPGGNILHSGNAVMAVDGTNVVPLATAVPLWREIRDGDSGEDVRALQAELDRLGYAVVADGQAGYATVRAAGRLLGLSGEALNGYEVVSPGSFLWIPAPDTSVAGCSLAVGSSLESGAEVFATSSSLTSARIKAVPSGAVPGPRKLVVDGVDIPLDGEGNVASPESLAALAGTETYRWWAESGGKEPLRVSYRLAEAERAYSVTPAAIANVSGSSGCVVDEAGTSRKVEIVASELGKTLVRFPDGHEAPAKVQLNGEAASCD